MTAKIEEGVLIAFKAPRWAAQAALELARHETITRGAFCRRALVEALRAAGVQPDEAP